MARHTPAEGRSCSRSCGECPIAARLNREVLGDQTPAGRAGYREAGGGASVIMRVLITAGPALTSRLRKTRMYAIITIAMTPTVTESHSTEGLVSVPLRLNRAWKTTPGMLPVSTAQYP